MKYFNNAVFLVQHQGGYEQYAHFDHYINGWKMGDANAELNDPILQRQLLSKQSVDGRGGDDDHPTSKM